MKKKKVVILSLTILLILILSLVLVFNKSIIRNLNGDVSDEFYNRTKFKSEEIYQCVIDEYNNQTGEEKTIDDTLDDNQLKETYVDNCELPESAKDKTIDLKGIDKLGGFFEISGAAEKVIISDMNFINSSFLSISIDAKTYEIHDILGDPSLKIKSNNDDYVIDALNFYHNDAGYCSLMLFGNYNNLNIYDNFTNDDLGEFLIDIKSSYYNESNHLDEYLNPTIANLNYYNNSVKGRIGVEDVSIKNVNIENNEGLIEWLELFNVDNMVINNSQIKELTIDGGNLSTIDLSSSTELELLIIKNIKLSNLDLSKNINLTDLSLSNNQLKSIDLSKNTHLINLDLSNNNFDDNFKYIVKNKEYNIKDVINLPGNTSYGVGDTLNIIKIENDILTGEKEGKTSFLVYNSRLYNGGFIGFIVNVYDITSGEYTIDKDKKEIIYKKDFDINKIILTDGYTASLNEDELTIKYDEDYVDTYKIVKEKEVTTTKKTDSKTTTKKNDNKEDANDKKESNNTIKNNNVVTTNVKNKDIYLNSNVIPSNTLRSIKGYNRNIIIENKDITLKVNGLNIKDASNSIDLNYIFIDLREYAKKEEIKDISNGYILKFKTKKELPVKVMVEMPYNNIKYKVDNKDIKVYSYNDNNYELVYKNNALNNKINFYINKLGTYVITNDEVQKVNKSEVYHDNVNLYVTNNKIVHNKNIYKRSVIILIFIIIDTILLLLFLISTKNNKNKTTIGGDNK